MQRSFYQTLVTTATFLAGVAATMFQVSSPNNGNSWQVAANTLFLTSLVSSIGTAVTSLVTLSWKQSFAYAILIMFYPSITHGDF